MKKESEKKTKAKKQTKSKESGSEKKRVSRKKQVSQSTSPKKETKRSEPAQEKKVLLLYCPRCKRETDNVITGFIGQKIRRVRCEVCKSEHNYHRIQALKRRMEGEKTAEVEQGREQLLQQQTYRLWEDLMLGRDTATARPYNIRDKYFENDLINHQVFGIGVVRSVLEDYKIEVVFKNSIKILAHNRFLAKR